MTPEKKLLIDRYLDNTLTGVELKEFLDRIEIDSEFSKEVSFQNLLVEGIKEAEEKRLEDLIIKHINYKKSSVPFALKLIFTFLFIIIAGISLWNYISPDSTGNKRDYFTFEFLKKPVKDSSLVRTPSNKSLQILRDSPNNKNEAVNDTSSITKNPAEFDSSQQAFAEAEDIVVKKDQMLISFILKSIVLDKDTIEKEASLAKNASDKLITESGLPVSEIKKTENYFVEFWVSPVNYKGYKLVNDKLILFGIDLPDAVQLFQKNEKLWMKYGQEIYSLAPTEQFESLVMANEIPAEIK